MSARLALAFLRAAEEDLAALAAFTRGGDGDRDVLTGWRVMESFPAAGVAAGAGNAAVLGALSDGVSGLVLRIGAHGIPAADVDRHLEGVFLELVPVVLDAGTDLLVAADAVLDLVAFALAFPLHGSVSLGGRLRPGLRAKRADTHLS